jgi:large subunit ribosomal protein L5
MSVLREEYEQTIRPQLQEKGGYRNCMEVPRLTKISVSCGIGSDKDREVFDEATKLLTEITGQRPVTTRARKSVANFNLRRGMNVGLQVTLRRQRMYDFFYRLVNVCLPSVRDFRGLSPKAFDGHGNYSMGLSEHSIFPEIDLDKMQHTIGMNINIVTTAKTNDEAFELLSMMNVPFANEEDQE